MNATSFQEVSDAQLEGFVGGRCIIVITKDKVITIGNCQNVVIEEK